MYVIKIHSDSLKVRSLTLLFAALEAEHGEKKIKLKTIKSTLNTHSLSLSLLTFPPFFCFPFPLFIFTYLTVTISANSFYIFKVSDWASKISVCSI
jgi:hypothetical protein